MNLLKIFRKSQNEQDKKIYTTQKIGVGRRESFITITLKHS